MIRLVPMSESELQVYLAVAIDHYATEHVKAGNWQFAEAHERSAKEFQQLLPNGVASPNQYLYSIVNDATGDTVGMIWFAVLKNRLQPAAFIYDFSIVEEQRRQGYGEQALRAIESKVKELGLDTIELHVFGHNHAAQALYAKTGYVVTDLHMKKTIAA